MKQPLTSQLVLESVMHRPYLWIKSVFLFSHLQVGARIYNADSLDLN